MNIQVIKSRRRTIGIEVHADGKVIVRTPLRMSLVKAFREHPLHVVHRERCKDIVTGRLCGDVKDY